MDTLCAILALIPEKGLKLHQIDVKGAYLNGTLQETIYMRQPEGCEDGMGCLCKLVKTLYGLKQAGHEWNNKLDGKLKVHEYRQLLSNPCTYIQQDGDKFGIMVIWVDDSLLFASSDLAMEHMKKTFHSEWEVTNLGEPSKIVGIKVTRTDNTITISQQRYIENILLKEGMANANPITIPMDPNMKLAPNPDENEPNQSNSYAKLLGCC
jgi:Reverse transcriptase (RNA-dependent DNA polymerase)